MSTFDTMPTDDLERRLGAWMGAQGPDADLTSTYDTIVDATRGARQRPWFLVRRGVRRTTPISPSAQFAGRALTSAIAVALALAVAGAAVLIGARLAHVNRAPQWLPAGAMAEPRGAFVLVLLPDGTVLAAGGGHGGVATATAERFDPSTGVWSPTGSMIAPRISATGTLLPTGQVLVAGGGGPSGSRRDVELYDPSSGTWRTTGSMQEPRNQATGIALDDGQVLVVGGTENDRPTAETYNPQTATWTRTGPMGHWRASASLTRLADGRILAAGGFEPQGQPFSTAEIYDPRSRSWSDAAHLLAIRADGQATLLLSDGTVLVTGGFSAPLPIGAEIYDPVRDTWTPAMPGLASVGGHALTQLPDGTLLASGGWDGTTSLASTQIGRLERQSWSTGPPMHEPRIGPDSVALPDSRLLIVGGAADYAGAIGIKSSELFDPGSP